MDMSKNIKPLTGVVDWPIWKRKIRDLLDYHEGALDVIDRKLVKPKPLEDGATDIEVKKHKEQSELYRKANSYAKCMITSAISDEVYQKVMDKETASDTWDALKQQFEASAKDQLFKICTDFFSFSWSPGEDVSTHIAKLKGLWNELNSGLKAKNESVLPDLMLVCKTLHILPCEFENFQSSWMLLTQDEKRTFDELTTQLCMFERNFMKNSNGDRTPKEALMVNVNKQKPGGKGKFVKNDSRRGDTCNYCRRKGHWLKDCRKWISDGKPKKNNSQEDCAAASAVLMSVCEEAYSVEEDSVTWWVDNGATRHVTNSSKYFTDFIKFDTPCGVKAAGKETLMAVGKGNIKLSSLTDSQDIMLLDVWYVPQLSRNLFSVLAAHDRNMNSEFKSSTRECWLKIDDKVVLHGTREPYGTLYKADIRPNLPKEIAVINAVEETSLLQLYHERWGHQDKNHVRVKLERELGISVPLEKAFCEPCIYGKAHRLPFGQREKTTKPGELISADVCGPFSESFQKKRYVVVFKDNYTKFRYCHIVRQKSEVKDALKFVLQHSKMLGHTIKELLSDNGGEFDNKEIQAILRAEGVTQRLTAPYTPQQNGGSEREMRTIVEMARTFKYSNKEANFPAAMWAELVAASVYILNRTGKSSVEGISPFELWFGKKPRIKHLRIIGSTCYAHIPVQKRQKMDKKAVKGYLVGYDGDERYRIWVKEENKVILSRDVIFHERPESCKAQVKLPLEDIEQNNQGKYAAQEEDEARPSKEESEESETEEDSDDTREGELLAQPHRQLRNRSTLVKPSWHKDFVMFTEDMMNQANEAPASYEEAINSSQSVHWKEAMQNEMKSLQENQTWELTALPEDAKAIPCKWVFRVKTNPNGSIDKYKARLVVKGFNQRYGVDYSETFSPVAKLSTIRSMLSVASAEKMHLTQFDVSTAFLYGELEEVIYMQQPEGYSDGTENVCKLKRSLYGLKQAPRCWSKRFGAFLVSAGFKASDADPCLHIREEGHKKLVVALYVDDGLVMASDQQDSKKFVEELKAEFKITVKPASYFLGLEIKRFDDGAIKISQEAYAKKILERFNFQDCKPVSTPIVKEPDTLQTEKKTAEKCNFPYRQAVGALMYLMLGTRPDLAYSVSFLSRTLDSASTEDVVRLKRVLRYVAGTCDLGIIYHPNLCSGILDCYSDADFGGCNKTGRSTSGVVITHAGGAISWFSQRQAMTATSTTEAELVAATEAVKEIIYMCRLFKGMSKLAEVPVLKVDNQATVKLAQNPEFHHRTKHIKIKYFFVREKVLEGELGIQHISTEDQLADILTKPLPKPRLLALCQKLGLSC